MTITNERRHDLHTRLEQVLGPEEATTLMDHLPPVGWGDVVTTTVLDLRLETRESRVRSEIHKGVGTR